MSTTLNQTVETMSNPLKLPAEDIFGELFNRRPFKIGHNLNGHPLLELPRIIELSKQLPENQIECKLGRVSVNLGSVQAPDNGLTPEETVNQIEQCNSWLLLKNVEVVKEYREMVDACLDQIGRIAQKTAPGMYLREGFIIVSSPGTVTPYHLDPENNFLLQIRGPKYVHLWDPTDRVVASEEDVEKLFSKGQRNLEFKESYVALEEKFELLPGEGLQFPISAPHWVENGPEASVSLSITFRTDYSARRESLHRLNHKLRGWGITPSPYGASPLRDELKYSLVRCARGVKKLTGKGQQIRPPYGPA